MPVVRRRALKSYHCRGTGHDGALYAGHLPASTMDRKEQVLTSLSIVFELYASSMLVIQNKSHMHGSAIKRDYSLSVCRGSPFRAVAQILTVVPSRCVTALALPALQQRKKYACHDSDTLNNTHSFLCRPVKLVSLVVECQYSDEAQCASKLAVGSQCAEPVTQNFGPPKRTDAYFASAASSTESIYMWGRMVGRGCWGCGSRLSHEV
ncbi:hypothetical protein FB567DRAFT_120106 [Paraphoma chrysanthemicola]|uniref:Uncharacterized protein n=1 Tax=Paraphoma chrysanthemicola TaxID=798071 RepID=A0A8K0R0F2_9PLEO|nr:hypothetical protein FB567DRAFT_120106 [Paraphoma chrysanthemicola]